MNTKLIIPAIAFLFFLVACGQTKTTNPDQTTNTTNGNHKVTVTEVLQASAYSYLNVDEEGKNYWIAVPSLEAAMGDVFYYTEFMVMENFVSKDLNRTFESVLFVSDISRDPIAPKNPMGQSTGKIKPSKLQIKLEPAEGCITLSELFANKEKYNKEKISVKGQVVKVNPGIMDRTWVHIQDGTESNGNFDLTVTLKEENIQVGQQLVFEGVLVLDKDFGYGYKYDLLLEDAVIK